jgi:hemin uptake protein HemP
VPDDQDIAVATARHRPIQPGHSGPPSAREVPVEVILGEEREAVIIHNGVRYRLRITSNDKLILTK